MYLNKKNNIKLKIINSLSPSSNLLIVENGNLLGDDFLENQEDKRFLLTLIKFSGTSPIQIEVIKVISKTGDNLKIERAVEETPLNYNSSESSRLAYEFNSGDYVFMNLTASEINKICEEIRNVKQNIENNYYKKGQVDEFIRGVNTFAGKIKINPGEDLNNIKNPGLYYNPGNSESDQILNHPKRQFDGHLHNLEQSAFGLLVYEASGVIQELTTYNLGYKFMRRFYDNNWSAWRVLYVDGTLNLGNTDKHNIAIGDSDTGFRQDGDGRLEMFCNNQRIFRSESGWIEFNKPVTTTVTNPPWDHCFVTKGYVDRNSIQEARVSDNVKLSSDSEVVSTDGSKAMKRIKLFVNGRVRITFEAKILHPVKYVDVLLFRDGTRRSSDGKSIRSYNYTRFITEFDVKNGDEIVLENQHSSGIYIRNFRICFDLVNLPYGEVSL